MNPKDQTARLAVLEMKIRAMVSSLSPLRRRAGEPISDKADAMVLLAMEALDKLATQIHKDGRAIYRAERKEA